MLIHLHLNLRYASDLTKPNINWSLISYLVKTGQDQH